MDIKRIKKIIDLLKVSDIGEIELHEGGDSVRVSRISQNVTPISPTLLSKVTPTPIPTSNTGNQLPAKSAEPVISGHVVTSPMVGKFYQSPSPDKPAYVKGGSVVKKGDTLCIVEAMKMMNPIESEVDGVVKTIFAQDGDAVEFGQNLFEIELN